MRPPTSPMVKRVILVARRLLNEQTFSESVGMSGAQMHAAAASPRPICAGRSGACHRARIRATRWLRRENHEATIGPSSLETHRLCDAPRRGCKYPPAKPGALDMGPLKRPVQIRSSICVASARNTFSVCHLNNHSATLGEQISRDTYIPTLGAAVSSCPSSNFLSCAWWLTIRRFDDGRPP